MTHIMSERREGKGWSIVNNCIEYGIFLILIIVAIVAIYKN